MTGNPTLLKVCESGREAEDFVAEQRQLILRRGLRSTWEVEARPLNKTRDGYPNYAGPWGVYLIKKES